MWQIKCLLNIDVSKFPEPENDWVHTQEELRLQMELNLLINLIKMGASPGLIIKLCSGLHVFVLLNQGTSVC